jgi:hypothetical protein
MTAVGPTETSAVKFAVMQCCTHSAVWYGVDSQLVGWPVAALDRMRMMRDFGEYLRAYWAHVLTSGWLKALGLLLAWVAGMFVPVGVRTFVQLPDWFAITWMICWAILGYVLAPYGMWKQQRAQIAKSGQPDPE